MLRCLGWHRSAALAAREALAPRPGDVLRQRSAVLRHCRATTPRRAQCDKRGGAGLAACGWSRPEFFAEIGKQRPGCLRLTALRTPRLLARHPAENVEMGKAPGVGDEAFEEQRSDDRAGMRAFGDVIHIGDVALDELVVGGPERQ